MKNKMSILLTNDDGINSKGLHALFTALKRIAQVIVVAPESEQSAVAHAITMSDPLRVKKHYFNKKYFGYAVSGTPADCVKIGVMSILKKCPDMVISGINLGPNAGFSVLYSGTVSGAREGAILGIPSIAVSLGTYRDPDFRIASLFTSRLAKMVYKNGLPDGVFLNVNVPKCSGNKVKGVKVVKQGLVPIIEKYDRRIDPRGNLYYWLTGEVMKIERGRDSDLSALSSCYISITPLKCDMTDYNFINELKSWKL